MARLIWTHQAIADLGSIGDHIAVDSEKYAKVTVQRLFDRTNILKQHPRIGRIVPERHDATGSYRPRQELRRGLIVSHGHLAERPSQVKVFPKAGVFVGLTYHLSKILSQ